MDGAGSNLYLVGFMGTGKSTVGWHVAKKLQFQFLDSDKEIEGRQGRTISEIFASDGETAFRALERAFVENGHPGAGCVVACGGGLIVPDGMLGLLRGKGVVVCLHAPFETVMERTARNNQRPLLEVEDRERRARELFAKRESIYRAAGTVVLTDKRPLREIVAHVLRVYQAEVRERRR